MKKLLFLLLLGVYLISMGCKSDRDDDDSPAPFTGTVTDATGEGVSGAVVVVGSSSSTYFTDEQGKFEIPGGIKSNQPMTVLAPGYRNRSSNLGKGQTNANLKLDEDEATEKAPKVTITSINATGSAIEVNAMINAAQGATITDARAELLGTGLGTVLTPGNGNNYSGNIATTQTTGSVMVFAVDDQDRHASDVKDLPGTPNQSFTGTRENWVGSVAGFHQGGLNHGRYPFNASLTIEADGTANGLGVFLKLAALPSSPIATETFTGTARVTGNIYRVSLNNADSSITLTLSGRVKTDGSIYTGSVHGKFGTDPYSGGFFLINTNILPNPWSAEALATTWGLSFFYKNPGLTPTEYQYNTLIRVDNLGAVATGTPSTLGATTVGGGVLQFTDVQGQNLGYFTGSPGIALSNGLSYRIYGLMGVGTRHVRGIWGTLSPNNVGIFWGMKNPVWASSDFDAQWQGFFKVTGGPDAGSYLNAQININDQGQVTGQGSIVPFPGSNLTGGNIVVSSGTLSFFDISVGGVTGDFTGTQNGLALTVKMSTPATPETASMGVYHARLIGKFEISVNGDTGYYFLYRNSKNNN